MTVFALQGGTRHYQYLSQEETTKILRLYWILQPLIVGTLVAAKISIAFLILRIVVSGTHWTKFTIYFCVVSTTIICSVAMIFNFVQCNPVRALWEQVPNQKCWDPRIEADFSVFAGSKIL